MLTYFVLVAILQVDNPPVFTVLDYFSKEDDCKTELVKVQKENSDDPRLLFQCMEWVAPKKEDK